MEVCSRNVGQIDTGDDSSLPLCREASIELDFFDLLQDLILGLVNLTAQESITLADLLSRT